MITRNFMYLRPGNLVKDIIVEPVREIADSMGRPKKSYDADAGIMFKGVLAAATPTEQIRWAQREHPITHTIVSYDKPRAKAEDKLVLGDRVFLVKGVDDADSLGIATIYHVEERTDLAW